MPPAAWWMTTSSLQATIDERTTALNSAYELIPSGIGTANSDWIDKADAQIGIRTETNIRTVDRLWDWQKTLVKWPPNVAKYMDSCEYRKEITDPAISRRVPIDYRRDYPLEVRRVWLLADPIGHAADPIPPKAAKKVWFPLDNMPQVNLEKWRNLPPSFIEIWNSQEDLWLLEQLLLAVQRTNSSSNSITDSFVRQIQEVALFGGDRVKPGDAAGATAASTPTSSEPGASGAPIGFPSSMGRRGPSHRIPSSARFNLAEEYTAKGLVSKSRSPMMGIMPSSEATGEKTGSAGAAGDDLNVDENRYITVADAYRTRGFQLIVTVHQQYVPDLVRELLNSQYPITIARIEQAALHPDEPDGSSTDPRRGPSMKSIASSAPGGAGFDASAYSDPTGGVPADYAETDGNTETSEDSFSDPSEGTSRVPITDEAVAAALDELDLVEVMIVGEMYLYNPPPVPEGGEAAAGTTGTEAPTGAPAAVQPGEAVQPGAVQPGEPEPPTATVPPATDTTSTPPTSVVPGNTEDATEPAPVTPVPATPSATSETPAPAPATPGTPGTTPAPEVDASAPSPVKPAN